MVTEPVKRILKIRYDTTRDGLDRHEFGVFPFVTQLNHCFVSGRELVFTFAICYRRSVGLLSVCRL